MCHHKCCLQKIMAKIWETPRWSQDSPWNFEWVGCEQDRSGYRTGHLIYMYGICKYKIRHCLFWHLCRHTKKRICTLCLFVYFFHKMIILLILFKSFRLVQSQKLGQTRLHLGIWAFELRQALIFNDLYLCFFLVWSKMVDN